MKLTQDAWLGIGLLVVLLLITAVVAIQQAQQEAPPAYVSFSSEPDGTHALLLWLDSLGYSVNQDSVSVFTPPENTDLMFMLEPSTIVIDDEWEVIDNWVENGGTLILAGDGIGTGFAFSHYGVRLTYSEPLSITLKPQTPLFTSPDLDTVNINAQAYLQIDRVDHDDLVTHLAIGSRPILISFTRGDGRIILSSAPFPFSNFGLKQSGNPELVLNIVSTISPLKNVWFDEWHHGIRTQQTEVVGPGNWLRYTATGHAFLYTFIIIFIAIILSGRRFGYPIQLRKNTNRRAPLEYITAIANMERRAGHRTQVLQQYYQRLKRSLGARYRLDPALPDDEYLKKLSQLNPNLDISSLHKLLSQLQRKNVNESEMVKLASEAATWLKEK